MLCIAELNHSLRIAKSKLKATQSELIQAKYGNIAISWINARKYY